VEWSVPDLAGLLADLAERFGSDRLQILAHSIGSRGTLFALAQLRLEGRTETIADHLVLLAPDFDAAAFERQFRLVRPMVERVTLYASDKDRPLSVSEALHGQSRLGQAGAALTVISGMETVDVSALGRIAMALWRWLAPAAPAVRALVVPRLEGTSAPVLVSTDEILQWGVESAPMSVVDAATDALPNGLALSMVSILVDWDHSQLGGPDPFVLLRNVYLAGNPTTGRNVLGTVRVPLDGLVDAQWCTTPTRTCSSATIPVTWSPSTTTWRARRPMAPSKSI
jgi:hypothetical protein